MCGIAGLVNFEGHRSDDARVRIKRMTDVLIHRGPDEEGFFVDNHAALGHRRLSIIDLASGKQPMDALDGKVQIVFNGEIYNFLEVRAELEARGHRFARRSDTEVILMAYLEWGEQCVEKLNGMFAFAIWDLRKKILFVGRDRVGKKPLYYFSDGPVFAFASELKALWAAGFGPGKIDPEALDCYFTFGYVPAPKTIHQNFKKLRPAHTIMVTENGIRENRYWSLSFGDPVEQSMDDAADEFEGLLDEAVKCRLMSEVPLGAFLSGGLDSPLVVSSMARTGNGSVLSNSIGFDDAQLNELPAARAVAVHLRTDHREFLVRPDALGVLKKIAWHFDEPFADSSAVPTWYVCKMARENVTVALSGDGGDESFGGYTFRYIPHAFESRIRQIFPASFRSLVFGPLGAVYPGSAWLPKPLRVKTIFENLAVSDAEAFYRDLAWLRADTRQAVYSPDFMNSLNGFTPFEMVRPFYAGSDARDALGRSQFTDINFYLTDDVLVKVDRMSMAHALEVRSPLLDHRIIEFAARLPGRLKIDNKLGKLLLRRVAERRLPAEVLNQPKRGFSIPADRWLRNELKPLAGQAIFNSSIVTDVLMRGRLQKIWDQHQLGVRDHSVFLWGLMMLGLWEDVHFKKV
jgi:asparagine synthase (glutamine-hydrolysing)